MAYLPLRQDSSEILAYNAPDYPVRTGGDPLSIYADYAADCHWHHDFEVLIADQGGIDYYANAKRVRLEEGDAILVNSRRLHYGYSAAREECFYRFAVFHPLIFGSMTPISAAIDQLASDSSQDYWLFSAQTKDGREAVQLVDTLCQAGAPEDAFAFLSAACQLLSIAIRQNSGDGAQADPAWAILRRMLSYIQQHYTEHILLEDIAAAGAVCRSRCCALFREKLYTTPNIYLTKYRLSRACAMMQAGATITDAALNCGFQSTSYFAETFRKHYGMPPREFRGMQS
ncbi:MAG: helix-turn-helix transcriptional regulator [Clostridia bacterium]|nr:helix-turn-helix transcriptional regulator [Clostridia bacterium]